MINLKVTDLRAHPNGAVYLLLEKLSDHYDVYFQVLTLHAPKEPWYGVLERSGSIQVISADWLALRTKEWISEDPS